MSDDFAVINAPRYTEATSSIAYVNEAGVPDDVVEAIKGSQEIASAIERWSRSLASGPATRSWDLFNRTAYQHNNQLFATFGACARAVENDDILSTLADTVERLAITHTKFEMQDDDQEDCWNQISDDLRLETRFREIFRELFKISQVYVGVWWEKKTYTVRTKPTQDDFNIQPPLPPDPITGLVPDQPEPPKKKKGNRQRKKQFAIMAPTAFTVFDPTKVIPVGTLMFGRERFAYCASRGEHQAFTRVFSDTEPLVDETVLKLIEGRYKPTEEERAFCTANEIDPDALWLFKKGTCFRHTLTRPQYQRFADVRLKSVLELLDMKAHLRASDRSALIGATNFIVVIRKGSDKLPARQAEIENLQEQAKIVARMPILVGDHRLQVDIVTPSVDHTLDEARYNTLDNRLIFRSLTSFSLPRNAGGSGTQGGGSGGSDISRVVGRGLESMRAELITTIKLQVFQEALDRNPSVLTEMPDMAFTPRTVSLDLSTDIINAMLKLRDRGDISRQTVLEEVGFNQDVEALRRSRERTVHDAVFTSIVPFSSPSATPFSTGSTGGRPTGSTAANGAKKPKARTDKAELDSDDADEETTS